MRILWISHTSEVAGGERSMLSAIAHAPPGVEMFVACPDGELAELLDRQGTPRRRLVATVLSRASVLSPLKGVAGLVRMGLNVRRVVNRDKIDVVIGNSTRATLAALAVPQSVPVMGYARELFSGSRIARLAQTIIMRRSPAVIANSHATARTLPAGRARLFVIYNGLDRTPFDLAQDLDLAELRASLGVPEGRKVLAVIGYLAPLKGQADLVQALAPLANREDWHLLVIGSVLFTSGSADTAKYAEDLRYMVSELEMSGRVTFLGERRDVAAVLRAVDIVLVPSWYESFSRVVVEGMLSGCAVVATNIGGPVELIEDGADGLLIPPRRPDLWRAAIRRLLDDEALSKRLGRAGKCKARSMPDPMQYAAGVVDAVREIAHG